MTKYAFSDLKMDIYIPSSGGGGRPCIFLIQCRTYPDVRWSSKKRVCVLEALSWFTFHKIMTLRIFFHDFPATIRFVNFIKHPKTNKIREKYKIQCPATQGSYWDRTNGPLHKKCICCALICTIWPRVSPIMSNMKNLICFLKSIDAFWKALTLFKKHPEAF